ncbi:uncharacterized protein FIBRA_04910 [Fibroporia radiculosa]|uniref:Uncharacterized protein n=1 Tax=Fibroporia radiculosa TaxID=599839 RepID=J4H378_9APHY|nr:uncharacterized protein FIBRA_04910 [Fibroporia radiculosa]CCM02799.1 predicted protein [Fibroporia radiculosa]
MTAKARRTVNPGLIKGGQQTGLHPQPQVSDIRTLLSSSHSLLAVMRSPIIAFSIVAATVGPTLVAAMSNSPGGNTPMRARVSEVKTNDNSPLPLERRGETPFNLKKASLKNSDILGSLEAPRGSNANPSTDSDSLGDANTVTDMANTAAKNDAETFQGAHVAPSEPTNPNPEGRAGSVLERPQPGSGMNGIKNANA